MAIGEGTLVSLKQVDGFQRRLIGVSQSAAAPFTVCWETGTLTAGILQSALRELAAAAAATQALIFARVKLTAAAAALYAHLMSDDARGIVIAMYNDVTGGDDIVRIRTQSGLEIDVFAAFVELDD
jgi:hypothetical protein